MHIGLNAHLLAKESGYRRAGIHTYIYNTLLHLPEIEPTWRYTALVGEGSPPPHPNLHVRRSRLNTASPLKRIVWEQIAQPFQLGEFDLVHQMAFVAPLIKPRPFVVTIYDLTFLRFPERLRASRRFYLQLMTRIACRRARRIVAISQSTADDLVSLMGIPRAKIDLAIPGIDPRFKSLSTAEIAAWRQAQGLPDRFLLYLGTLEPRKNLATLLHAYAALPESDRQRVPLVLAGGRGWMVEEIDQIIEQRGLSATVQRPGFVADEALPFWYNAAEAFLFPSVFEGWGMPITEAMACGKPVIVSNISSLPEAAGDAGLLLPPTDVSAWTDALARCISNATWRQEAAAKSLARATLFSWRTTAQQTVDSYKRALGLLKN
ncbi:MAG: glycosyltransferase family 4 protein [Anaerolineae bacterium]|nr:glycosyltransferase family 4 protein [Anaerolineae bacterium]